MAQHGTQAVIGWGAQLRRGNADGPPETFTPVTEVVSFDPPQDSADEVEVTHFEATNRRKLFIRGLIDSGTCACTVNWNPTLYTSHLALRNDFADGLNRNYQFALPGDIEVYTFTAFLKELKPKVSPSGALQADITFRVSNVNIETNT